MKADLPRNSTFRLPPPRWRFRVDPQHQTGHVLGRVARVVVVRARWRRVEPGSRLAAVLGDAASPVNSLHHQGVASAPAPLRVSARAPDGLIEAIEREDLPFCLGVQWHPEKLPDPHRQRLFSAFVAACAAI